MVSHEAFWAKIRARQLCISGSAPALQATSRAAGLGQKKTQQKENSKMTLDDLLLMIFIWR